MSPLIVLATLFLQQETPQPQTARRTDIGLRGVVLFPLSSQFSNLEPIYGGGFMFRFPLPAQDFYLDAALDIYFGHGRADVSALGITVNAPVDVNVYHLFVNGVWRPEGEHGPVAWAGIGGANATALAKATIMGFEAQKSFSDTSFTVQGGVGYGYKNAEIGFSVVYLPNNAAFDVGGVLSLSIRF